MPVITRAAVESVDFLGRVSAKGRAAAEEEEADTRGARDRDLDVFDGVDDPWRFAKTDWSRPTYQFPTL